MALGILTLKPKSCLDSRFRSFVLWTISLVALLGLVVALVRRYRKGLAENGVSRTVAIVDEKQVPDDKYGLPAQD